MCHFTQRNLFVLASLSTFPSAYGVFATHDHADINTTKFQELFFQILFLEKLRILGKSGRLVVEYAYFLEHKQIRHADSSILWCHNGVRLKSVSLYCLL